MGPPALSLVAVLVTPPAPAPPGPLVPDGEATRMAERPVSEHVTYRPGAGLTVASRDGDYALTLNVFGQLLYTLLEDPTALPPRTEALELRRGRLMLSGNVLGRHNKYNVQVSFAPREIGMNPEGSLRRAPVLNFMLRFDYLRDLTLVVGQYKVPYNRQRMVAITGLNLVDRSLANFEFTFDRDLGVELRSDDLAGIGRLRYSVGAYGGHGFDNFVPHEPGLLYMARIDVLPMGLFDDYVEADFERSRQARLSLGLAYAFHDNATSDAGGLATPPTDGGTSDYHNATFDFMLKVAGFSWEGAFFWRDGWRSPGGATDPETGELRPISLPRDGLGWFAQPGFLVPKVPLELVLRAGQTIPLGLASSLDFRGELGGGLSYYVRRHSLKLQLDYFRLWTGTEISDGADQIRGQLQLSF